MPKRSVRIYSLLLGAYPPSFRRRFGEGMKKVFARQIDQAQQGGSASLALVCVRALTDWLVSVPREWIDVARHGGGEMVRKMFGDFWQDVRYGARGLARRPTMTLVLTATLGFGIGGVTAIESVLRGTLFRELPYPEPENIHLFSNAGSWAARDLAVIEEGTPSLESVAAYHATQVVVQGDDGRVSAENALVVSRDFFEVLGRGLHLGSGFGPGAHAAGGPPSVVIAHSLWQEMGGTPSVIGDFVMVDGIDVSVAGVTPPGFYFPDPGTRIFRPLQLPPTGADRFLTIVSRVSGSATPPSLRREMAGIRQVIGRTNEEGAESLRLIPVREAVFGQGSEPMFLAAGALMLVLLMAVINVGTLSLSSTRERVRELAVRRAIGATRHRLTRQLMTESALLGVLGAMAALAFGLLCYRLLVGSLPISAGDASRLAVDLRFVTVTLALGLAIGGGTGLAASLAVPVGEANGGGRFSHRSTARSSLLQNGLVISQIALSVTLVGGAGVMIRSVSELSGIDTGVTPGDAIVLDAVVAAGDYPQSERAELYRLLRASIAELPETEAVGLTQKLPLRGPGWTTSVSDPLSSDDPSFVTIRFISPGYFEALGVPVLSGRAPVASTDGPGGAPVAWVNQALAGALWPGREPSGQVRAWGVLRQVVGVVGDVSEAGLTDSFEPAVYVPIEQTPRFLNFTVVARPRPGAAGQYAALVQSRLREDLPRLAIQSVVPFAEIEETAQGDTLMIMRLLVLLSTLALLVAAVGVHGVMSQWVSARKRGWAVSLALGETPRGVLGTVVRRSTALTLGGVALGIVLFAAGGTALDSFVFGVARVDPRSLLVTALVIFVTGVIGAAGPALRAGRTDPMSLLKLQ